VKGQEAQPDPHRRFDIGLTDRQRAEGFADPDPNHDDRDDDCETQGQQVHHHATDLTTSELTCTLPALLQCPSLDGEHLRDDRRPENHGHHQFTKVVQHQHEDQREDGGHEPRCEDVSPVPAQRRP
jgi:hypothetical protein